MRKRVRFEMNEIDNVNKQIYLEREYKNFVNNLKKIKQDNDGQLKNEKTASRQRVKQIKDEYVRNEESLRNQLQTKLHRLRSSHQKIINEEQARLENEFKLLQKSHLEKMAELTETQNSQIEEKNNSTREKLESIELQFQREKSKLGA